ncbi:ubiquitin-conjugating enzyme E2 [Desulfobacterales bacterium HSG16]|nr:ubiquitin-conjugating enzyme E2 [Desulfobacterales bacterium HSG16]
MAMSESNESIRADSYESDRSNEIRLVLETQSGEKFICSVPRDMKLSTIIADFFEELELQATDSKGQGLRGVIDLADPENPNRTKRLNSDQTVEEAGLFDGATLRFFPESIAGAVDERERIRALVADHRDMEELAGWNDHIKFDANTSHAPTRYVITFDYKGFKELSPDGHTPSKSTHHQVEIILSADYPRTAPLVRWLTPVFHPNIDPATGGVCLGVIMDRYMPGLGLARLTTMLAEMVQYRNFDQFNPMNKAAAKWAANPEHEHFITDIGGSVCQGPIHEIRKLIENSLSGENERTPVKFTRLRRKGIYDDR